MTDHSPLAIPDLVQEANDHYRNCRDALLPKILSGTSGQALSEELVTIADQWLLTLWKCAIPDDLRPLLSLHATGGYGRCELALESDLDVLIAVHDEKLIENKTLSLATERLMAWTRAARARFSHAVRSPSQVGPALRQDLRTAIALLDLRPLAGPKSPETFQRALVLRYLRGDHNGRDLVRNLFEGHRQRVARHGETVFLLEPDLKNGEGGLRDLNYLAWAASIRWNLDIGESTLPDEGWSDDERKRYLTSIDALLGLRNKVHLLRGRKHDRLTFRDQEALIRWPRQEFSSLSAAQQALKELQAPLNDDEARAALNPEIEALMAAYYRQARQIATTTERCLRLWASSPAPAQKLEGPFVRRSEELDISPDALLSDDDLFFALQLAAREDLLLAPLLEARIEEQVQSWPSGEELSPHLAHQFCALLVEPDAHWRTSQRLLELGFLPRVVPEFEPLLCHVQHDLYHVYTTDVHSLKCLEAARTLLRAGENHRWPFFAHIAAQIENQRVFLLASLYHDIGKNRGGGHSEKGAELMKTVAPRHGLTPQECTDLVFLVAHHLDLSNTSRRRDISDPAIISDLAENIATVERLNQLTALTCCDMATVGPEVMNDWNASLLSQLYHHLREALEFGIEREYRNEPDQREKRRLDLSHSLELYAQLDSSYCDDFINELPLDHLLDTDLEVLFRQYRTYSEARKDQDQIAVTLTPLEDRGVTEVVVCAPDQPGTLARIAGAIASTGINIMAADIVTTQRSLTLDIFHIAHFNPRAVPPTPPRPVEGPARLDRITSRIIEVLRREVDVEDLLSRRRDEQRLAPRQIPGVTTEVRLADDVSDHFTVLEVHTQDHLGLLYSIASSLLRSRVNTRVSRVDSIGNRAIDTFYIEEWDGERLSHERIAEVIANLEEDLSKH